MNIATIARILWLRRRLRGHERWPANRFAAHQHTELQALRRFAGMTPLGYRQTVRVSGRAEVLPNLSVGALNGWGGESWPTSISTSIVAFPVEELLGTVQAECSTGAREAW